MSVRRLLLSFLVISTISTSIALAQPAGDAVQPVDVYLRSVRIALSTNPPEWDRAQKNLETARLHYPENFEVHLLMGTIWAEKDEIDSMIYEYDLARKYATPSEWQKKAKDLDKVLESKWLEQFNRGVNLLSQSDSIADLAQQASDSSTADSLEVVVGKIRNMAVESLRRSVLLKPGDFRAFATRGIVYQRMGNNDIGLSDFVVAESLFHKVEFTDSTTNWYDTTVFFTGAGDKTEAFKAFENKYKKLTDEKRTRYNNLLRSLGAAYYDKQDCKNSIVINRRYLGLFPKDINAIVTLADCFSRMGMEGEAYKWQEITVTEDPNNKDTWYNLGIFYYNNAVRLQDSITTTTKSVERGDSGAKAKRLEFLVNSLLNFARAVPRFKKVVEIDEQDSDTWRLLGICYYSVATLSLDEQLGNDRPRQQQVLDDAWKLMNGSTGSFDKMQIWKDSEPTLEKAAMLFPDDQGVCRMLKVTYAQLNKIDKVRECAAKCP